MVVMRDACPPPWEAPLSESEPISFRPREGNGALELNGGSSRGAANRGGNTTLGPAAGSHAVTAFHRQELQLILDVYGRMVAAGEWRDYALDMGREKAVFSVFRRTSECALYRIEKTPKLARKQGAYSVVSATGLILKRGNDLRRVLAVLEKGLRVVE